MRSNAARATSSALTLPPATAAAISTAELSGPVMAEHRSEFHFFAEWKFHYRLRQIGDTLEIYQDTGPVLCVYGQTERRRIGVHHGLDVSVMQLLVCWRHPFFL